MNRRQFLFNATSAAALAHAGRIADPPVKRVLVMFKCHLDVGFVDTQAAIIKKYFEVYFPQAIRSWLPICTYAAMNAMCGQQARG